jgi:transcriptional regulator with XRE-family HTH domain
MKIDTLTPEPEILRELGRRLARIRKQQRFTQEELAKQAGLGVATLRRIETGQDSQFSSWIKLLRVLNMLSAIELLLPENYNSPLTEAIAEKQRKRGSPVNSVGATDWEWGGK